MVKWKAQPVAVAGSTDFVTDTWAGWDRLSTGCKHHLLDARPNSGIGSPLLSRVAVGVPKPG
jgi:hypothetical protein